MKSIAVSMFALLGAGFSVGFIGGCSSRTTYVQADQELTPPVADEATQLRNFDTTVATYANGDAIAGNTGFVYTPERYRPSWQYYFIDSGVYFTNLVVSPFSLIANHDPIHYEGLRFEPSYTLNPVLPPMQSSAEAEVPTTVSPIPVTLDEPSDVPADDSTINEPTTESPVDVMPDPERPDAPIEPEVPVEPATPDEPEPTMP